MTVSLRTRWWNNEFPNLTDTSLVTLASKHLRKPSHELLQIKIWFDVTDLDSHACRRVVYVEKIAFQEQLLLEECNKIASETSEAHNLPINLQKDLADAILMSFVRSRITQSLNAAKTFMLQQNGGVITRIEVPIIPIRRFRLYIVHRFTRCCFFCILRCCDSSGGIVCPGDLDCLLNGTGQFSRPMRDCFNPGV